jgi:putative DNA primase/helicase
MQAVVPEIDTSLADRVHIHYCARPRFTGAPVSFDPVAACGVPLIWLRTGGLLAVPADLDLQGQWAEAEALAKAEVTQRQVQHPDIETAIAAIGSDGDIYPHIRAAVHLWLRAGGISANLSPEEIGLEIQRDLRVLTMRHKPTILMQLKERSWKDVEIRLERGRDYAAWLVRRDDSYRGRGVMRKSVDWNAPDEGYSLKDGRDALNHACDDFVDAIDNEDETVFEPGRLTRGLRGTTGIGKSQAAHDIISRLLMRAVKNNQPVIYASSRHVLGAEQLQRLIAKQPLVCAQWRGRQAEDPEQPGRPMCERHVEARAVGLAGSDPTKLCKHNRAHCAFYDSCGYRRQQKQHASVWFVAHDALLHEQPDNIGTPVAVIIDESPMNAMLFGIDENVELKPDALRNPPQRLKSFEAEELLAFRQALWAVFNKSNIGPLPLDYVRKQFYAHPQIAPHIRRMIALEWRELAPLNVHPGMSKEAVLAAANNCGDNLAVLMRIQLYELIAEAIEDGTTVSGRIVVIQRSLTGRSIAMWGIRPMREGWKAPILALDATLDMRLLRRLWPQAVEAANIKVTLPMHVKVTQVVNNPFTKGWLTAPGREVKRAGEVYGAILGEIILSGAVGPTLIITHKAVEEVLRREAHIPSWVELAHHGDITGIDRWKGCRHLVVIGRPLPTAEEACRITEALFGEYIPRRVYTPTKVNIRIVPDAQGNNAVEVMQMRHDDPNVEAVRRQVTEAAIVQAAGRARGIARTEETPLDIWLLTDIKVEELEPVHARLWGEFACNADAQMFARGLWLENHADAAMIYPELFTSAGALTKQRARAGNRTFLYKGLSIKKRPIAPPALVSLVRYIHSGVGARPSRALFLSPVEPDLQTWLRGRLGDPGLRRVG